MPARIYLDHAATAPIIPAALDAMREAAARWANPSSPHAEGRAAKAALERARAEVAAAYAWPGELLFTSGASEALRLAWDRALLPARAASAVEHDAVLRLTGPETAVLPVGADGLVQQTGAFVACPSTALRTNGEEGAARREGLSGVPTRKDPFVLSEVEGHAPPATLTCVQWANSETGVIQDIPAIAAAVHAAGGLLLLDAAQMPAGADPEAIAAADFVALSAHKRGGPAGIGALLVRDLATLAPTGGQERGYRPGTENVPAAAGYAAALAEPEPDHAPLRARLDDAIRRSGGIVVADGSPRHPAIASYRLPGLAGTAQMIRLDLAGFAVSTGSACASGSLKPSHVLAAMGWDEAAGREVIRVSFGRTTTAADVDAFVAAWRDLARAARRIAA